MRKGVSIVILATVTIRFLGLFLASVAPVAVSAEPCTLHLAGDSTLAWRRPDESSGSWGEALRSKLCPSARICNYAIAGRSTVTFRPQWETNLIGRVKDGDYVLIQFGHNDPWHSPKKLVDREGCDRYCTVEAFRTNLTRYVREARAKGAKVLLLTPTPQRAFFSGTEWKPSKNHLPYFAVIPEVARETGADFIDMTARGGEIVKAMGVEGSRSFYRVNTNGKPDDIHPNKTGAKRLADLFLDEVKSRGLSVRELFRSDGDTDETESVQRRLDYCFRAGGGTRFLAEKCRCYGPAEYLFRGSLSKAEKAEGLKASQTGRRKMLALFTYYADKLLDIREQPKEMTFRDIMVEDADRFLHYNFSGNETWQLGMPLGSVRFENVTATGLKSPLCAYGEEGRPVLLAFDRVSVRFARTVPEFICGAWIRELAVKDLTVEGVEGPFSRNWSTRMPKLQFEGAAPNDRTVQAATGEFKVRPI